MRTLNFIFFHLFFFLFLTSCQHTKKEEKPRKYQSFREILMESKRKMQKKEEKQVEYLIRSYNIESDYENHEFDLYLRRTLNQLEKKLVHQLEKNQYYNLKPFMKNNKERIEFLLIPNLKDKEIWIQKQKAKNPKTKKSTFIKDLIQKSDIIPGMTQDEVKMSLGYPNNVSIAGNPLYRNEKWEYVNSSPLDIDKVKQVITIYFEGGIVSGWERY